jgi:hypothetical protein
MKTDNLRNFTVRFLESALRRVESTAKPFYGGRLSTGEAIRRLAEERLDEIENSSPQESTHQALLRLVGAWRSGQVLSLSDLQWLAQAVNDAYQRCRRDFVAKDLLVADVGAFGDAVRAATRGKAKGIEPEEQYFLKNLGTAKDIDAKTLPEYVDKWASRLADRPSPSQAEFASRNLLTYLRDEEFGNEAQLAKTLAQYVPGLLQVAIRGHWEAQRMPLIERAKGASPDTPRDMRPITVGNVRLIPEARHDGIVATLEMSARQSRVFVRNFVELEELAEVTRLASLGVESSGGSFEWHIGDGKAKAYTLSCDRARWEMDAKDFESLAQCLESLYGEPWMIALVERLRYVYGRI